MKILISGVSGVGKTSLCERIVEIAEEKGWKCGGVLCPVAGEGSTAIDLSTGEKEEMATTDSKAEGIPVGNYIINENGISLGKKAIRNAIENGSGIIFIDEIGPLERTGKGLFPEAERAMATEKDVIIVIRKKMLEEFTGKFPGIGFRTFTINRENRDQLAEKIMGELNAA
ncbi:MAG: nucleoside-triphosphatase [Candidatus Altiarchaeales archaeon]|nr:nucleoside-triphosphatase [Candidatus Altiarchaeota archaeon]MBU4341775.1 nucleoside-triphosphatase [Candidatus Altiarchaeota archaeon]MBU4437657.1 nucleoside-triphosphatase [Candidatus Altiarchaeota archaeon]MCG2782887.1 nucleoside-triphosphatase [Candidatus Altiarchaeales archaeon]